MIAWFKALPFVLARIGLEAGPFSQWLYAGLNEAGFAVELLETRHVRDAFKAMPVKTDRKDARGIAQLMRLGSVGRCIAGIQCPARSLDPTQPKSHSPPRPPAPTTAEKRLPAEQRDIPAAVAALHARRLVP